MFPTEGLAYALSSNNKYYLCNGIGAATDTDIVVNSVYESLPVTKISDNAFNGQSQLTSVTIPASIESFGSNAFNNCSALTAVYFGGNLTDWCNINIPIYAYTANPLRYAQNLYINNQLLVDLVIPNNITKIGDNAFLNCNSIKTITFPQNGNISEIGNSAFRILNGNTSVESINIPETVTKISGSAFDGQLALKEINFGNGVKILQDQVCYSCGNLAKIHLGNAVTEIQGFLRNAGQGVWKWSNKGIYTIKTLKPPILQTGGLPTWQTGYGNVQEFYYVPYDFNPNTGNRSIEDYKVSTNWSAKASAMFPLVNTISGLANIDTTAYTRACVVGNEEYIEYQYINNQWEVVQ